MVSKQLNTSNDKAWISMSFFMFIKWKKSVSNIALIMSMKYAYNPSYMHWLLCTSNKIKKIANLGVQFSFLKSYISENFFAGCVFIFFVCSIFIKLRRVTNEYNKESKQQIYVGEGKL